MNDELKDLILGTSFDEPEEEQPEFSLMESVSHNSKREKEPTIEENIEKIEITEAPKHESIPENKDEIIENNDTEDLFIIPDTPIFSMSPDVPEEKTHTSHNGDLLNIDHFSDYKSKDAAFWPDPIPSVSAERQERFEEPITAENIETLENITILNTEPENEPIEEKKREEKREDPDRIGYNQKKPRLIDTKFEFVELFVFTLLAVVLLTTFVFRHSVVDGSSMESTLSHNDHLIIVDLFYEPEHGDIIVFHAPETGESEPLVKRVIATEGDTVEILWDGVVLVNDVPIPDDYIKDEVYDNSKYQPMQKVTVPEDMVFVLGDNRNNSLDSRRFKGTFVREDAILGKVVLRIYPNFGFVE